MSLTILFLDESLSFIIDVFALSRVISSEQIAWEKVHVYRKIERFSLSFFSFYMWLRLLLAKLKRPIFIKFPKDIQIHIRYLIRLDLFLKTFLEYLKLHINCCFWRWFIPFFIHILVLTFSVLILLKTWLGKPNVACFPGNKNVQLINE